MARPGAGRAEGLGLLRAPSGPTLTEEFRQQERGRGRRSFYYFYSAICGFTADDPDTGEPTIGEFHQDLCAFLEGSGKHHPYTRAVVCCSRGTGKSVAVMIYILWRCIYIVNFSALIISNSAENAKKLHFLPLIELIKYSPRADYLRWLYYDRIPADFGDTNSEQLDLIRTDPLAPPAITYAGMDSKLEGKHPDLIVLDDPEGADAEKSTSANDSALALWDRVRFLPKYPLRSQTILVGTPWGRKPLVWQLRDKYNWQEDADNETCEVKFFWRPIEDANGKSIWPARFPREVIDSLRRDKLARSQCWLERDTGGFTLFDMEAVTQASYTWLHGERNEIAYRGFRFNPDEIGEDGYVRPRMTDAVVHLREMRYFIHMDPLHKTAEFKRQISITKNRPAKAAITVIGVASDWHAFLVDYWTDDVMIDVQAEELFRLYRAWAPMAVTFEAIGAQVWLRTFIEKQEKQDPNWGRPKTSGRLGPPGMSLPRMSRRLFEDDKRNQSKEWLWRESLSPWLNQGVLHINLNQGEVVRQLEGVLNDSVAVDLVDCLAQGPPVWRPGQGDLEGREYEERRAFVDAFVRQAPGAAGRAGFQPPAWSGNYRLIRGGR